jgi:hypothetical protein
MERDFSSLEQVFSVEAGSKALQPHRCDMPVAITARSLEQIELLGSTFKESSAQLTQQGGIVAGRCRKGRIKSTVIESHDRQIGRIELMRGLSRIRLWYDVSYGRTAPDARFGAQERR